MFPVGDNEFRVLVAGGGDAVRDSLADGSVEAGRPLAVVDGDPAVVWGDALADRAVDCVLVDGREYDDGGVDAVAAVRETGPPLPVVVLVDGDDRAVRDALAAGATDAVPRCVIEDPSLLAERVVAAAEREQARTAVGDVFDGIAGPVAVYDADTGRTVHANRALCDLLGYDREQLLSLDVEDVTADVPGFDDERATEVVERAADRDGGVEADWPVATADGEVRWLEASFSPVAVGGREYVLAAAREVTEWRHRERAVRELQAATERMQHADSVERVAETAVEAAADALGLPVAACWFHDEDSGRLEPVAATDAVRERGLLSPLGPNRYEYEAFREDEVTTYVPREENPDNPLETAVLLPLGDHGLIAAGRPEETESDDVTMDVARTLAEHTESALDRVERARAVRESERRLRIVSERIDQVIFLAAPDFSEMLYVNDAYEDVWGRPVDELSEDPRRFIEHVDDRDRDEFEAAFEEMLADIAAGDASDAYEFRFRVRRPDGDVRWVRATGYPVDGDDPRFVGVAEDVTGQRELERTYRSVFENVSDGLVVHDPDTGEILDVNERFCEMNGYAREALVGETIDVVTAPGYDYEEAQRRVEAARERGPQLFEWRNQRSDGETFPVEVHLSVVDVRGEERVLASVRDVTERKRREREYEQIFDGVNDSIVVQDPETAQPLDANRTFVERLGYDSVEEIREAGFEALSATDAGYTTERAREICHRVMETGEPETVEWQQETKSGERRWIEATVTAAEIGGEDRVLSIQRDVTERKRRERMVRALHEATDDLQDAETPRQVCAAAVDAATEVLDLRAPTCWLHGVDAPDALSPVASGDAVCDFPPDGRPHPLEPGDREYEVFEAGERRICDPSDLDGGTPPGDAVLVPLGDHGLFGAVERDGGFDDVTLDAAGILARHVTSALDRVERARELRESERRFRLIADHIDEIVYLATADFSEILYINDAYEEIYGRPVEELSEDPTSFVEAAHPDDRDDYEADVQRLVEDVDAGDPQDAYEGEYRIRRDGETRWVTVTRFPVENDEGVVDRIVGRVQDVTGRKRSEQRLRAILDRIDEAIFLTRAHAITETAQEPDYVSAGYEDIWGQPLEAIRDRYQDGFFGTLHPEDEREYRSFVESMVADVDAGTADDRYSLEYRIRRPDGEHRWVQSDYYPVEWEDGVPRVVIVSRDVTDRKDRERRLASFEDATEDLTTADTREEAARTAVDAAADALDLSAVGVLLYDRSDGVLEAAAQSAALPSAVGERTVGPDDGRLWDAFAAGETVDSGRTTGGGGADGTVDSGGPAADLEAALADWRAIPLGNHGVLFVGSPDGALDPDALQSAHVLAGTLEAALNHLHGKRQLATREEELRTEAERAERLDRIARLTHQVEAAITDASAPATVERAVCERLVDVTPYEAAWVGSVEVGTDRIAPDTVVGEPDGYVKAMDLTTTNDTADRHPAVEAWQRDAVAVVDSVVGSGPTEDWREHVLSRGYQSVCAVPLTYDGMTHGVLSVAADAPNAFGERTLDVLEQLGTSIAHALAGIERRRALEADETVELEFRGDGASLSFARLAAEAGCRVRHERTVQRDGGVSVYFALEGDLPEAVSETASRVLSGSVEVVRDEPDAVLLEVRAETWFGAPLAEYGAVLRRAAATPEETTVVVELPARTDVRSFADRVRELAPSLELEARRQHHREQRTAGEFRNRIEADLTDRQHKALRTAFDEGYFEWPRESNGSEVADRLGITQPTFNKHLRLAERKTFAALFEEGT